MDSGQWSVISGQLTVDSEQKRVTPFKKGKGKGERGKVMEKGKGRREKIYIFLTGNPLLPKDENFLRKIDKPPPLGSPD